MSTTFSPTSPVRGLVPAKVRTVPAYPAPTPARDGWLIMLHVVIVAVCLALPAAAAIHAAGSRAERPTNALVWSNDGHRPLPALGRAG